MSEAAFLTAIRAEPADDAARLVYADWLQENGEDARAELIRVQIELTCPLPPRPSTMTYSLVSSEAHIQQVLAYKAATERRRTLELRERELLATVRVPLPPGWLLGVGLGLTVRAPRGELFLRRGLGERAVCSGSVWVADGDAILALHPVERVRLTSLPHTHAEAHGLTLRGDPQRRYWTWSVVEATLRAGNYKGDVAHARLALHLRYGTNITFELP